MTFHAQLPLPSRPEISVDEGLVVLIDHLIGIGAETEYSCQDDTRSEAYISFADARILEIFIALAKDLAEGAGARGMLARAFGIRYLAGRSSPDPARPAWTYRVFPNDPSLLDGAKLGVRFYVRFHTDDLAQMTEWLSSSD